MKTLWKRDFYKSTDGKSKEEKFIEILTRDSFPLSLKHINTKYIKVNLHTCSFRTFFSCHIGFISDTEIKKRLRSFGPKCFWKAPMMIKISNAIPMDMTTDGSDCWLLLKLGVSVPSSTAGRGLRNCPRGQPHPQGPTVEGGRPAARSSPAGPGGGRTRPLERAGLSNSHCCSADGVP